MTRPQQQQRAQRHEEPQAPAVHDKKPSARTVTVGCKLPNGLILQLQRKEKYQEPTMNGMKEMERFVFTGPRYIIAGPAYPVMAPAGYPRQVEIRGGFGLTPRVPGEFWDEWVEQNKLNPVVTSGAIFAESTQVDVEAVAREYAGLKTGMEPLEVTRDEVTDKRVPKPQNPNVFYSMTEASKANAA